MAHFNVPIPQIYRSTQTETPKTIDQINILSLLRKRDKKTWKYPMINNTRRYTKNSQVSSLLSYFYTEVNKHIKLQIEQRTQEVQLLLNSFVMKVADIFCFFIDICLPAAAFLDCHGTLIILHTLGLELIIVQISILSFNKRIPFIQICCEHNNDNVKWPPL